MSLTSAEVGVRKTAGSVGVIGMSEFSNLDGPTAAAQKALAFATEGNEKVSTADAPRAVSPPLPLYDFAKAHVQAPAGQSNKAVGGSTTRPAAGSCPASWLPACIKPPKTGVNVPMIWPPPHHIRYVSPEPEPLYIKRPNLVEDMMIHDAERLQRPESVLNRVIFDSVELPPHLKAPGRQSPSAAADTGHTGHTGLPPGDLAPYYQAESEEDTTLIFESRFEGGNLRRAIQVYEYEYDLILKPDINTRGHTQWYYFRVQNMRKGVTYKFNVINLLKPDSLYNSGMRPLYYSQVEAEEHGIGWFRRGEDICYYQNHIKRKGGYYYTLTFTLDFIHGSDDTAYLSYCHPFSCVHSLGCDTCLAC